MSKKWYVVHAYSQYENHVRKALLDRVERAGLTDFFGDILVPTEEVVEIREGQKRTTERKFFPGYILVEMEMSEGNYLAGDISPTVIIPNVGLPRSPPCQVIVGAAMGRSTQQE